MVTSLTNFAALVQSAAFSGGAKVAVATGSGVSSGIGVSVGGRVSVAVGASIVGEAVGESVFGGVCVPQAERMLAVRIISESILVDMFFSL
jgi:hypothetical protein